MWWRISFVALLFASILTACGDRERVNCPPMVKNKALRAATTITVDTASLGSTRTVESKCL
jgi:predicted small lipoprotein YifL